MMKISGYDSFLLAISGGLNGLNLDVRVSVLNLKTSLDREPHCTLSRCHKISGSAKTAQFGGLLWSLDLVLMSDVRFVERRGYLTLCLEAQGITRTYLRRTDGIRNVSLEMLILLHSP